MAINIKPSHKGLLHKDLGVAQDKPIPASKLKKAESSGSAAVKKRAVFAENAKHWNHNGGKHASQPHPETNPGFYDTEPHAPGKKIANHPLTPMPAVGSQPPAVVPKSPGRISGLGGSNHQFSKPPISSHGYGHAAHNRVGAMRLSGHSGAHRIGKK